MQENLLSFVISFFIGLLIGIEREHSHQEGVQPIGVRTFILFSLLGTLAATLHELVLTLATSLFVFSIILLGYLQSTKTTRKEIDVGITTEVAAGIIFCVGYIIPSANLLAIIISALVLLVLVERQRLHILARKKFKPHAIETAIIAVIFTLGILPILPNHTIDPWGVFNPYDFGILIVAIAAIQFVGFVSIRLFGERFGIAVTGLFGGFISSTVVFANLHRVLHSHPKFKLAIIASAILANLAMMLEILLIIFIASPGLFLFIVKPILVMAVLSIIFATVLLRFQKGKKQVASPSTEIFNWGSLFYTAIFIGLIVITITIVKRFISPDALLIVSFVGGLFEVHGITLATALLYLTNQITSLAASSILYVALLAAYVSKFVLLWLTTPKKFALITSLFLLVILISGAITYNLNFPMTL
jgi:uncharacterized membrane protein (DUF4010 family)